MSRFNLINESWIKVIYCEEETSKLVSLETLFKDVHRIRFFTGDTRAQDFAVFRVILAILNTVYSRFDADGNAYEYFEIGGNWKPVSVLDEDDYENYIESLDKTWKKLWDKGKFTEIVIDYLYKWYERFYLFDEEFPFFQVTSKDLTEDKISKKTPSIIMGKSFNRRLSESNNKISLFSPKYDGSKSSEKDNKEKLTEAEVARWLLAYHSYTGLADKVIFGKDKYKASKGWLFDLGAVFIIGDNMFESLMMNLILTHTEEPYAFNTQRPCWEYSSAELIDLYLKNNLPDNLAQLYTTWSRAIYIDPAINLKEAFSCQIVKLPEVEHKNMFLEPMTIWQFNKNGENKNFYTPRKHRFNQSMWRSFGLFAMPSEESKRQPGIMEWFDKKTEVIGDKEIALVAISMMDDGNATSWLPVDEIYDFLKINDYVIADISENNWVPRIESAVEITKAIIEKTYRIFLSDIAEIRNIKDKTKEGFINREIETVYFNVDIPFRNWLRNLKLTDSKDKKVIEWREILHSIVKNRADNLLKNATMRDLRGIDKGDSVLNIAVVYNNFIRFLNKELKS